MKDGFVSVAAITPSIRVADVAFNVAAVAEAAKAAAEAGARVIVAPELCLTGATCGDLFWQQALLDAAEDGVLALADATEGLDALIFAGAPVRTGGAVYDCAVVLNAGEVLGLVPATAPSDWRHFAPAPEEMDIIDFAGFAELPFGTDQLFACENVRGLRVAAEVGDDLAEPMAPSCAHALAGASLVVNLAAPRALAGAAERLRAAVLAQSERLACAYVLAGAGAGESTTDFAYSGQCVIAENGELLAEARPFQGGPAITEIDAQLLAHERLRRGFAEDAAGYIETRFVLDDVETALTRPVNPFPFVPADEARLPERCEEVLAIQAAGLAKRMAHIGAKRAVIGASGGLDSTLALLVIARAFDLLSLERSGITAITMPGFGTTARTKGNAERLSEALGASLRAIDITAAVRQHFSDIGQSEDVHDATYENAQARERTQILMDLSNKEGGLVVGTGDLSELALGWATYNGDHMSMYGVNGGVPKTLIRHLVRHVADTCGDEAVASVLLDVLATPVSPELLPAEADGTISQQTENIVGPYELHDFFLYHMLRHGFGPAKIYRLARHAWGGSYDDATILTWLTIFIRRFFSQQFKRSCLPDGVAVGSVGVSPREGLAMPSDALAAVWLAELEQL